jgi:hypothetical protein
MINLTRKTVLHLYTLQLPDIGRTLMIRNAANFYSELGIKIEEGLKLNFGDDPVAQNLKHREIRKDCDLDPDAVPTDQEKELYEYKRPDTIPREIVVYFIESTRPSTWGCAYRHNRMASIIITQGATSWTCAHEVGHIHGLTHVNDPNNLMYKNPKFTVKPYLNNKQIETVLASPFLFPYSDPT